MTEIIYCIFALLIGWCSYWAGVDRGFTIGVNALKRHLQIEMQKYEGILTNDKPNPDKNTENNV